MEAFLIKFVVAAVCALVVCGSIRRLDMLRAGVNRPEWIAFYTLAPVFAFGIILDMASGRVVDWYEAAGLVAFELQIWATRAVWAHGSPPNTRKEAP